MVYLFFQRFR